MLPRQTRYAYSPITRRPDYTWPGGKRLAVYLALGIEEYVFGDGLTEDLFPGAPKPDYANTSWRDYGNRVGGFRLIDRFAREGFPVTLLLNTEVYDHAPDLVDFARTRGCEIVAHGLTNSHTLAGRSRQHEAAYLRAVADAITAHEGAPPAGWSSPWLAHTENTPDLLVQAGYRYVLDLGMDDQPVWLNAAGGAALVHTLRFGAERQLHHHRTAGECGRLRPDDHRPVRRDDRGRGRATASDADRGAFVHLGSTVSPARDAPGADAYCGAAR